MDRPATKSSKVDLTSRTPRILWIALSLFCTLAAFACYEQAVMLPACLLGIAVYFQLNQHKVNWGWQASFWSILVFYLLIRHQVIPPGKSPYQVQQLKTSFAGPLTDLASFVFPPLGTLSSMRAEADEGIWIVFDPGFYGNVWTWVVYGSGLFLLSKRWKLALLGWLLPFIAFAPMAFVKFFEHYYYFPMALRTIFLVPMFMVGCDRTLNALSPLELQAPRRFRPSPGSLLGR